MFLHLYLQLIVTYDFHIFQTQFVTYKNLQQFDKTLPKANYIVLLKKLEKDLIESTLLPLDKKSKKDHQTYYLTNS
jgi:hypothetical protein